MTDWKFKARRARHLEGGTFIAWCARVGSQAELKDGPLEISKEIEVHFEFGESEDAAIAKLKDEVNA